MTKLKRSWWISTRSIKKNNKKCNKKKEAVSDSVLFEYIYKKQQIEKSNRFNLFYLFDITFYILFNFIFILISKIINEPCN